MISSVRTLYHKPEDHVVEAQSSNTFQTSFAVLHYHKQNMCAYHYCSIKYVGVPLGIENINKVSTLSILVFWDLSLFSEFKVFKWATQQNNNSVGTSLYVLTSKTTTLWQP
jgi:hypothetical protein